MFSKVIVHVSLVSRLFKNSTACVQVHMFFASQDCHWVVANTVLFSPLDIHPLQP